MTDKSTASDFQWRNGRQYYAAIVGKLNSFPSSSSVCFFFWLVSVFAPISLAIQFLGNLVMLGYGTILGWPSPAIPKLESPNTPLVSGPLTNEQISWIGSITAIGAMCGSLTFGYISARLGVKRSIMFLALPSTVFWFLIYFGKTYHLILLARYEVISIIKWKKKYKFNLSNKFHRFISGWTGGGIQTTSMQLGLLLSENQ